jgi:hypothetical protein
VRCMCVVHVRGACARCMCVVHVRGACARCMCVVQNATLRQPIDSWHSSPERSGSPPSLYFRLPCGSLPILYGTVYPVTRQSLFTHMCRGTWSYSVDDHYEPWGFFPPTGPPPGPQLPPGHEFVYVHTRPGTCAIVTCAMAVGFFLDAASRLHSCSEQNSMVIHTLRLLKGAGNETRLVTHAVVPAEGRVIGTTCCTRAPLAPTPPYAVSTVVLSLSA